MFNSIDKIASWAKDCGFIYPSSEIYGKFAGVYDYGYYGTLLKANIQNAWIREMVQKRQDVILIDSAIFMHPTTWKASGHVDSFDDPQIDCKKCKARHRADVLLESYGVQVDDKTPIDEMNKVIDDLKAKGTKFVCPICGSDALTPAKKFSLMVKSNLGAPTDELKEENVVYLRAETCQGIYLNYKNVLDSTRMRPPFGIAQVGKAFRNEIIARQFVFRTREFEQMEMQYFCHPSEVPTRYAAWKQARMDWYLKYGIPQERLRFHKHEKLAHYASEAYDIEYNFNCLGDFKEVEGIHARGDWDLSQHTKFSNVKLNYLDPKTNERYTPNVVETSVGLNRLLLTFIDNAHKTEKLETGEEREVLLLDKRLCPIKVAVFPLLKNKPELVSKAKEVFDLVSPNFFVEFDDNGNIGKRYRRQDEIGTPYCVTVDFDTLGSEDDSLKDTITIRDRDTMKQERISLENLNKYLMDNIK